MILQLKKRAILVQEPGYRVQFEPIIRPIETLQAGQLHQLDLLAWNPVNDSPCVFTVSIPHSTTLLPVTKTAPDFKGTKGTFSVSLSFIPSAETTSLSFNTKDLGCIIDEVFVKNIGQPANKTDFIGEARTITLAPNQFATTTSKYNMTPTRPRSIADTSPIKVSGPGMSQSLIVGLSFAFAIIFIVASMFFYFCLRRRRQKREIEENIIFKAMERKRHNSISIVAVPTAKRLSQVADMDRVLRKESLHGMYRLVI
jgi:hypothetical protein